MRAKKGGDVLRHRLSQKDVIYMRPTDMWTGIGGAGSLTHHKVRRSYFEGRIVHEHIGWGGFAATVEIPSESMHIDGEMVALTITANEGRWCNC